MRRKSLRRSFEPSVSNALAKNPIHQHCPFFSFSFFFIEPPLLGPSAGGFPPYGPPEFHQSAGDVGTGAGAAAGGWKPPTVHPTGLMKDPPLAAGGRNGPSNFVQQGQQQGAVMMVYGLDNDTSNTDKLFNLVCLYGNVARVSIECLPSVFFS